MRLSKLNPEADEFVPQIWQQSANCNAALDDAIEWLLLDVNRHFQLLRYGFRRKNSLLLSGVAEVDDLARDPLVKIDKADLYGGCKRAIISFSRNDGTPQQLQVDVIDRGAFVAFLQRRQIKISSRFDLTKK